MAVGDAGASEEAASDVGVRSGILDKLGVHDLALGGAEGWPKGKNVSARDSFKKDIAFQPFIPFCNKETHVSARPSTWKADGRCEPNAEHPTTHQPQISIKINSNGRTDNMKGVYR